jgi:NAD(P)-dependent dehydrogenase (short-subunit alcohol dehydrogenase family)
MLQGKAFLITGAGGALSRALIPAFHQAGARLFLSDPRPERMAERAQAVGAKTFVADLTRLEEALALARFVEEEAPLYGVVHTVGGFAAGRFLDTDPGLYDWMLDLNLRTTFNLLKAVLPYQAGGGLLRRLRRRPRLDGGGPGKGPLHRGQNRPGEPLEVLAGGGGGGALPRGLPHGHPGHGGQPQGHARGGLLPLDRPRARGQGGGGGGGG